MRRINPDEVKLLKEAVKTVLYALERGVLPPFVVPRETPRDEKGLVAYLAEALRIGPSTDRTKRWRVAVSLSGFELSVMEKNVALPALPKGAKYRLVDLVALTLLAKMGWTFSLRNVLWDTIPDATPLAEHRCSIYGDSIAVVKTAHRDLAENEVLGTPHCLLGV